MKILYLTTHLNAGGITSYLKNLLDGVRREGHEVSLASAGGEREDHFALEGARLLRTNWKTKSLLSPRLWSSCSSLRKFVVAENIDLIHAQTRVTQVLASALSALTGRPNVTTCHGFFRPRWGRKLIPAWGQKVIAISPSVREHLIRDLGVAEDRVEMIFNGIAVKDFEPVSDERDKSLRKEWKLDGRTVIGSVARLSDVKGQDILIEAFEILHRERPDTCLLLVGEGKTQADLEEMIARKKLSDCVRIHTASSEPSRWLSLMDVVAIPSRNEGLGLAALEAFAARRPVVAAAVGGLKDIIETDQTALLCAPEDPVSLSGALERMISDAVLRESFVGKARKVVDEKYSARQMVHKTLDLYRTILDGEQVTRSNEAGDHNPAG